MRHLWTDEELDQALSDLHADVRPDPVGLARAREQLIAAPVRRRPRHLSPVAAAAAALLLVTGTVVLRPHTEQPAAPPPHAALNELLGRITYADPAVGPGQFRFIQQRTWTGGPANPRNGDNHLTDSTRQVWRPALWTDLWQSHEWVDGTLDAKAVNGTITAVGDEQKFHLDIGDSKAPCGDFDSTHPGVTGHPPCVGQHGSWSSPTPDWIAALPTSWQQLAARLTVDAAQTHLSPVQLAALALKSGLLPASTRSALYRALSSLPGVYGLSSATNLDGRTGLALGLDTGDTSDQIVVDPAGGQFLGERRFDRKTGAVSTFSAMRYAVVDGLGVSPG